MWVSNCNTQFSSHASVIPITNVHNTLTATALGVPGHQEQICGWTPAQACHSLWNSSASSLDFYLRLGWARPSLASSGRHLYPQVICSAVGSCLSKTQATPWSRSQWDEVSFFALLSEHPITLVHLQGALSPVAFIQKATLHPAGLTWSHAFQKTFFICCIDPLKREATSQEQPAGRVAWPFPKWCLCKSQVWFCGKALHPDPSSSGRLKEIVFLAVPVPTSCAVAWRCDSPLGHAEPSQSYVTPQKDWWVTQELLMLPSPAPSPSTTSAARSAGVLTWQGTQGSAPHRFSLPARQWQFLQKSLREKENAVQLLHVTYSHILNFEGQSPSGSSYPASPCFHKAMWGLQESMDYACL